MVRNILWAVIAAGALCACGGREAAPAQTAASPGVASAQPAVDPASVERIAPDVARARAQSGQALLVCAYDDARCAQNQIEGAIPFSALEARLPELPRDQEIILYCA